MANYSLVINSKFKPFDYNDFLQPVLAATQAHREVEDAYSELATKTNIWDKMTEPGSKAHSIYEAYSKALEKQADELAKNGLTPGSRQAMLNMRNRYTSDITPIENAYKRREEQIKQQNELMSKDPTHFFARRASETSLDDYLGNPSLDTMAQNYSGAVLTKQVSDAAAALAKDARNDPRVQTELRKLLPYQYEVIRRTGFDPETVRQAVLNSPNADKILVGLVDNAIAGSGIADWNFASPKDKERILEQARREASKGLWSAVGQTTYNQVSDDYGKQVALEGIRHRNAMAEAREKAKTPGEGAATGNQKYRMLTSAKVNGDVSRLQEDLEFMKNLNLNNLSKKPGRGSSNMYLPSMGINLSVGTSKQSDYDAALSRYRDIAKRYGIDATNLDSGVRETIMNNLTRDIRNNVIKSRTYQLNMTDQSQVSQIIGENSNTMFRSNRKRSGLKALDDDGSVGKELTSTEAGDVFKNGSNFNFSYDPNMGYLLSYIDGKNEFKTVSIDPELINFGTDDYSRAHRQMQSYISNGQYAEAQDLADEIMSSLYYRFNTQGIKQSSTGTVK